MSIGEIILTLFAGLVIIFGAGRIIGHLVKIDKYLEDVESKSADLTITGRSKDVE